MTKCQLTIDNIGSDHDHIHHPPPQALNNNICVHFSVEPSLITLALIYPRNVYQITKMNYDAILEKTIAYQQAGPLSIAGFRARPVPI